MSSFVSLTPELLDRLLADPASPGLRDPAEAAVFRQRALMQLDQIGIPVAYAMLEGDRVLAAYGVVLHWVGRAESWMIFARAANIRDRVRATRFAAEWLGELQRHAAFRRIEAWICASEPWVDAFTRAVGMICETPNGARCWDPQGRDHFLYARVAPHRIEGAGA